MGAIDYAPFEVLTFDCYGTLIDWESGIDTALRAALGDHDREQLLTLFSRHEYAAEHPYKGYRDVLSLTLQAVAADLGVTVTDDQATTFGGSVGDWPAFADSGDALRRLQTRFQLAVITNCDDDLFAASETRLGVRFDHVITAQQVGSYKPDLANFHFAHEKIGVPRERILHVAQSLYHDHVPAKQLGMTTVWINRRAAAGGSGGATPPAEAMPDAMFADMHSFADDVGT
jgi:2-haloacid dehalogenase